MLSQMYFFASKVAAVFYDALAYLKISEATDWNDFTPEQLVSLEMQVYVDSYYAETGTMPIELIAQINHTMTA